jgi:hypothetical protein
MTDHINWDTQPKAGWSEFQQARALSGASPPRGRRYSPAHREFARRSSRSRQRVGEVPGFGPMPRRGIRAPRV